MNQRKALSQAERRQGGRRSPRKVFRNRRHALATPTGKVRHEHRVRQVELGLVDEEPSSWTSHP
jgi:hypothetical protein